MLKPCRLELNNSGAWKLLGRFDAAQDDQADEIMVAAASLADALNAAAGRHAITLRIATDDTHPDVLMRHAGDGKGWQKASREAQA